MREGCEIKLKIALSNSLHPLPGFSAIGLPYVQKHRQKTEECVLELTCNKWNQYHATAQDSQTVCEESQCKLRK